MGDVGLVDRQLDQCEVASALAQWFQDVAQLGVLDVDHAVGVAGTEGVRGCQDEMTAPGRGVADVELTGDAAAGCCRRGQCLLDPLIADAEAVPQLCADGRQLHVAAGALEQFGADGAFLLLDGLTDAGSGDMQSVRGPAEVQLLRQRQEDLYLTQFHASRP